MALSAGLTALCQAQGVDTPEGAIRGACSKFLQALGLSRAPIALKPLCDALDVAVHWRDAPTEHLRGDASLAVEGGKLEIRVHRRSPAGWRHSRLLIAHEITHALLLRLLRDKTLIDSLDATKQDMLALERLCDLGAHELLMPSTAFRQSMSRLALGPASLRALYDEYLVTTSAAAARLAYLTPRGAVVRLREFARSPEEATEWRVASCFPRYEKRSLRPWLPRGATLKHFEPPPDITLLRDSTMPQIGRLNVLVSGRGWNCEFTAFSSLDTRQRAAPRPIFEEFEVPDEPAARTRDILVFLREATLLEAAPRQARKKSILKSITI